MSARSSSSSPTKHHHRYCCCWCWCKRTMTQGYCTTITLLYFFCSSSSHLLSISIWIEYLCCSALFFHFAFCDYLNVGLDIDGNRICQYMFVSFRSVCIYTHTHLVYIFSQSISLFAFNARTHNSNSYIARFQFNFNF